MPFLLAKFAGPAFLRDPEIMVNTIKAEIRAKRKEAADYVLDQIEERTPVLTGALREDATYKLGSGSVLAQFYFDTQNQMSEWHRYYAEFQEGPPLGVKTYTNDPHQMIYGTQNSQEVADEVARIMGEAVQEGADAGLGGTVEL